MANLGFTVYYAEQCMYLSYTDSFCFMKVLFLKYMLLAEVIHVGLPVARLFIVMQGHGIGF